MFGRNKKNKDPLEEKKEKLKDDLEKQKLLLQEKRAEYESLKKDYDEKFEKFDKASDIEAEILAPELDMLDEDIQTVISDISEIGTNIRNLRKLLGSIPEADIGITSVTENEIDDIMRQGTLIRKKNKEKQKRINEKMNLYGKISSSYGGAEQVESKHMKMRERMKKEREDFSPETQKQEDEKKRENNQ
ncbi:hypothetical protein [Caldiplasma sukawensis]